MKRHPGTKLWLAFFVGLLALCIAGTGFAAPVNLQTALQVSETYLDVQQEQFSRQLAVPGAGDQFADFTVAESKTLFDDAGKPLAYLFNLDPAGFVILAPDTEITPVIAYSLKATLDFDNLDEGMILELVRLDMVKRLALLPETSTALKEKNERQWRAYLDRQTEQLRSAALRGTTYGPLLTSTWNQGSPYNDYCPMDPTTYDRSIVGCVATAMAQVVNYHQYPSSVAFSAADNYTTDIRGIYVTAASASFSSLSWPLNNDEAAKLSYACGVAVEMDYTSDSSGAYSSDVDDQLTGRFGYSSAVNVTPLAANTWATYESNFYTHLANNMQASKPAILGIKGYENGQRLGHEIVCDGYNSSNSMYHLNYGWGANGPTPPWWYNLPTGMPANYDTISDGILDIDPGNGGGGSTAEITELYPVSNAACGATAELWANVKNTGSAALPSSVAVWFYVDGPNWAGDHWVGYTSVAGINSGVIEWRALNWVIPAGIPAGTYTYKAAVWDSAAEKYLSDVSEPQSFTVTCGGTADPEAEISETYPVNNAACGSTATLKASVYNSGTVTFSSSINVWFYVDGPGCAEWTDTEKYVGHTSVSGMAPGANLRKSCNWAIPAGLPAGTYNFWAMVWDSDAGKMISEWSRAQSFTVTCGGTADPEAEISETYPVNNAACGSTATLKASVYNSGTVTFSSSINVWFYVDGPGCAEWTDTEKYVGHTSVSGMTPGANHLKSYSWAIPAGLPAGTYNFWAMVWDSDAGQMISEWSRAQSFTVTCGSVNCSFNEQFTSTPSGWSAYGGQWQGSVLNDYLFTFGVSGKTNAYLYGREASDFTYEAKFWRGENQGSASDFNANMLFFRVSGSQNADGFFQNGYEFAFTREGDYALYKVVNGTESPIQDWASSAYIIKGSAWNTLKVIVSGSSIRCYINSHLVWSGTDSSLTSGKSGVGCYLSSGASATSFWVDYAVQTASSSSSVGLRGLEQIDPAQLEANRRARENPSRDSNGEF